MEIGKNTTRLLKAIMKNKSTSPTTDVVLLDHRGRLVATDAYRMLIVENEDWGNNEEVDYLLNVSGKPIKGFNFDTLVLGFPAAVRKELDYADYERLIPNKTEECEEIQLSDVNDNVDIVLHRLYQKVCFRYTHIVDIVKAGAVQSAVLQQDKIHPFIIEGWIDGHKFKYVVMPIIL